MRIVMQLAVAGLMVGTLYGLVGFTLTLMFRSTGVLSFAHAGFALVGAYMYTGLTCRPRTATLGATACDAFLSPWQSALVSVAVTTLLALLVERLVIRPMQHADSSIRSLATAAVLALGSGVVLQLFGLQARNLPQDKALVPAGGFNLVGVVVEWKRFLVFALSIGLVVGLAWLLRRSWLGLGVRAAGQLPEVSRLMGIRPVAVSRFNWALGGALAGLAGVLIAPLTNVNIGTFSFLLVKAVGAALIGGLVSLPLTFAGGIALGLVETVTPHYWSRPGSSSVAIAVLVFLALLINAKRLKHYAVHSRAVRAQESPGPMVTAVARFCFGVGEVARRVPRPLWAVAVLGAAALPLHNEFYAAVGLNGLFYALAALSFVLITGSCGQPSLMQMGFVGIGAYTVTTALYRGVPFAAAVAMAMALCFVIGLGAGFLALRFRGVEFAILTLTLAAVVSDFVLADPRLQSSMGNPKVLGVDLLRPQNAYLVVLGFTALAFLAVANIRRSGWGRDLVSLREGKRILAHFGGNPTRVEAITFGLSSAIAGLAGVAYAILASQFGTFQFVPLFSITLLLAALVGGLRSLWGPVITGVIFGIGPATMQKLSTNSANAYPQIVASLLVLVLLVAAPDGLASLIAWARSTLARVPDRPQFRGAPLPLPDVRATSDLARPAAPRPLSRPAVGATAPSR